MSEAPDAPRAWRAISTRLINIGGLAIALLILIAIVSSQSEFALTPRNILNVGRAVAITGVVAAATTAVLIAGELDFSIGATLGLSGIVSATVIASGAPFLAGLAAGFATGAAVGLTNAALIVGVGVNPFIATLGMMFTLRGLSYVWTDGKSVVVFANALGAGAEYTYTGPFGYLNLVKPIGKGWANNPFYDGGFGSANPVVDGDWSFSDGRTSFGNHAFSRLGGQIFDASGGQVDTDSDPDTLPAGVPRALDGNDSWLSSYRVRVIDDVPASSPGTPTVYAFAVY